MVRIRACTLALLLVGGCLPAWAQCGPNQRLVPPSAEDFPYDTTAASDLSTVLGDGAISGYALLHGAWPRYDAALASLETLPLVEGPGFRSFEARDANLLIEAPPRAELCDRHGNVLLALAGHDANPTRVARAAKDLPRLVAEFTAATQRALATARGHVERDRRLPETLAMLDRLRALKGMDDLAEQARVLHEGLLDRGERLLEEALALQASDVRRARRSLKALVDDYAGTAIAERAAGAL